MPYIREERRLPVEILGPKNAGDLHYALTVMILAYLGLKPDYQRYCDVEGVLGHAAKELYRRRVVPFETRKIAENGDVYPNDQ